MLGYLKRFSEPVEAQRRRPEDRVELVGVEIAGVLAELGDRAGELGVGMREVAGPHDVVGAERAHAARREPVLGIASTRRTGARSTPTATSDRPAVSLPAIHSRWSSSRASQYGTQPVPDSRNATRRLGWRSSAPSSMRLAIAAICSSGCEHACRSAKPSKRSRPIVGAAQPETLVHREHEAGLLERVVERVVRAVAEVAAVEMVRARHHRDEPERGARVASPRPRAPGRRAARCRRRPAGLRRARSTRATQSS